MKQYEINRAYPSIAKLIDANLPVKKARAVYDMYMALETSYNFAVREQQKYLKEHNITMGRGGSLKFHGENKDEDYAVFKSKLDALLNSDVDLGIAPITLTEDDVGDQRISAVDIHNLSGFVFFD